ncbi:MAG: hypothetical protein JNK81_04210 [Anaerolineales bacterium]|nr:hypothetical protein [Anaerolineales bacterium]
MYIKKPLKSVLGGMLYVLFFTIISLSAEEEDGGGEAYQEVPDSLIELDNTWMKIRSKYKYPMYCVLLAADSDKEVGTMILNNRNEISEIMGKECFFLYFRSLERAKELLPYEHEENSKWAYPIAKLLGINLTELPCLLFFDFFVSGQYTTIKLSDMSQEKVISFLRKEFDLIRHRHPNNPLGTIEKYWLAQRTSVTKKAIAENIKDIGLDVLKDLIKSLIKFS